MAMALATGWERKLIFLTDGGITGGQTDTVLNMVANSTSAMSWMPEFTRSAESISAEHTQVYSLGIGNGVHRPLLDGLADRCCATANVAIVAMTPSC